MNIALLILGIFCSLPVIAFLVGWYLSEPGYTGPKTDHFDGNKFRNLSRREAKNLRGVSEYARKRRPDKWVRNYETFVRDTPLPLVAEDTIQVTYVNHSTFLIQTPTMNILTDPIWSERCSPVQFAGPRRMRPPGLRFEDLPDIDLVLLSHNHYDHFDVNTLKKIEKAWSPAYFAPLGVDKLLQKIGCSNVQAFDWGDKASVKNIEVKCTPANHFSARGMLDRNKTLWCGYLLYIENFKLYFVGDTGYGDQFKKIGEQEGEIDLALIPIGAYMPEWFMSPIHISPPEAVQVHKDIRAKNSIAKHFGTFPLADDNPERSTHYLNQSLEKEGISQETFLIPDEGHSYLYLIK